MKLNVFRLDIVQAGAQKLYGIYRGNRKKEMTGWRLIAVCDCSSLVVYIRYVPGPESHPHF